jgi:hypothetical protein
MLTINYFSDNRLQFFNLIFYFINKVKKVNKDKLKINILTTINNQSFFIEEIKKYDLYFNVVTFQNGFNYTEKLTYAINSQTKYSVKLDEDCIINNYIWDYMIENVELLDNDENLLLSPVLSTSMPSCDIFIQNFLNEEEKETIHEFFLKQEMPNGLFGINYSPLNKYTINAEKWEYDKYLSGLNDLPTETKGNHPIRISYNAQIKINEFILNKYEKLIEKNNYNIFEINSPYFTNNLFFIRTDVWKKICNQYNGVYDEIPISNYKRLGNKKFLFVENGFGVHTMFNTIYGDGTGNPWGIGGPNSQFKENEFVKKLEELIIK